MVEHKKSPLTHGNELKGRVKLYTPLFYNNHTAFAIAPIQGEYSE
ncbi:hypothetical protein MKY34_05965 [Sporosarcina sp. FSL K6-1522]